MSDVENRLRDLRQATDGQLRPSPDLLARIESSLEPRIWWRWPMALAVAAVAVVVVMLAPTGGREQDQRVASGPPSQADFVASMNQRCAEFVAETEKVVVLFDTPEAYALAAENRIGAISRSVERVRSIGAPAGASGLLEEVEARAAEADARGRAALAAARSGDTAVAAAELDRLDAAVMEIGQLLASHGAETCRPTQGR